MSGERDSAGVLLALLWCGTGCDVNETITTFCGPEEFRLHIRTLLVMCHVCVRAVRGCRGVAMIVMISSILDAYGRSCLTVRAGRAPPCSANVAPDTPTGVSRPEVL